jgi:hypothetical protein
MKAPLAAVHESGLALCVDFPRCRNSDALGSKADTRRSLGCIGRTRLTHCGHGPDLNPAMRRSPAVLRCAILSSEAQKA